jgi:hypothetical protein
MVLSNRTASTLDHVTSYASDSAPEMPKAQKAERATRLYDFEPIGVGSTM